MPRYDSRTLSAVDPAFAALMLGGANLGFGLLGFVYAMRGFRLVDIPITGLLWFIVAWLSLGSRKRREQSLVGLLLASAGFAVPLLVFMLDPLHPWRA